MISGVASDAFSCLRGTCKKQKLFLEISRVVIKDSSVHVLYDIRVWRHVFCYNRYAKRCVFKEFDWAFALVEIIIGQRNYPDIDVQPCLLVWMSLNGNPRMEFIPAGWDVLDAPLEFSTADNKPQPLISLERFRKSRANARKILVMACPAVP